MTQPTHNLGVGDLSQEPGSLGSASGGAVNSGSPSDAGGEVLATTTGSSGSSGSAGSSDGGLTDTAKDTAKEAADRGRDVAGTAAGEAKALASEAKSQLTNLFEQLRGELNTQASDQGRRAARGLGSLGDELRQMADAAPQDGVAGDMVRRLEEQIRSASQWLENREPGELLEEVRGVARRRPGAFLAGAALLGLVGGRLTRGLTAGSGSGSGGNGTRTGTTGSTGTYGAGNGSAYGATGASATVVPTGSTPAPVPDAGVTGLDTEQGLR